MRPLATGSLSSFIMPHGWRFGQSRSASTVRIATCPARSSGPIGTPPGSPARGDALRAPALTAPLACSRSSSSAKAFVTYGSCPGDGTRSSPNWQRADSDNSDHARGRLVARAVGRSGRSPLPPRSNIMTDDKTRRSRRPPNSIFQPFPPIRSSTNGGTATTDGRSRPAPGTTAGSRPDARAGSDRNGGPARSGGRRIDPTTFEKQYTDDELEFMNAMQRFKERTGKAFPTHGEVIKVAVSLGYRKPLEDEAPVLPGRTSRTSPSVRDRLSRSGRPISSSRLRNGKRRAQGPPPVDRLSNPWSHLPAADLGLRDRHQCRTGEDVQPGVDGVPRQVHGAIELARRAWRRETGNLGRTRGTVSDGT